MATIPHHHLHQLAFLPSCPTSSYSSSPSPSPPSLLSLSTKHRSFKILCCLSIKESTNDNQITAQEPSSPTKNNLRVVLAAGGTGGHIIPAVAIADELRVSNPNIEILFIGTPNSMESTSIPSAGYPFTSIPPVKLFRPLVSLENLSLPVHLIHSIIHSFKLLKEFDPHVVIGTGGYVSFPTCLAALLQRTKIVIHEQNSVPGIANYVLSYFSHLVFLSYNSTIECFPKKHNCVVTGNPVRVSLRQFVSRAVARLEFFPMAGEEAKVILVLGGSLGANAINIALLNVYSQMLLEHKDWYIIWQTGVESYNEMESLVRNHSNLVLKPFLHSMDLAYAAADLIVSRAGAMTCSEILATGKSAILIPSPDVAEGHQFKNASLMADVAGTRVITEDELDSTTLGTAIEEILDNFKIFLKNWPWGEITEQQDNGGALKLYLPENYKSLVSSKIVRWCAINFKQLTDRFFLTRSIDTMQFLSELVIS